jgi:hypothetical protein
MNTKPVLDEAHIVLIGSFNTAIFHPQWMAKHRMLPESECNAADVEIIHPEISRFKTSWFSLEVLPQRFFINCQNISMCEAMRDLVVSILQVLPETPVDAVGINRAQVFDTGSAENWHAIGDKLAPKDIWRAVLPSSPNIGMNKLEVQCAREDDLPGVVNVTVEPLGINRACFRVNNHILFDEFKKRNPDFSMSDFLEQKWDNLHEYSNNVIENVLKGIQNS